MNTTQAERLKQLRRKAGLNQSQVAAMIGKSRSCLAGYETSDNAQIPYPTLEKLAQIYKCTPEYIESGQQASIDTQDKITGKNIRPLVVTVDSTGKENIVVIPVKARAGYMLGYGDPEYIKTLYTCSLPGFTNSTYRIFEVEGHSMNSTLESGDMVVASYVENWSDIKDDDVYVVVSEDGIVVKRVQNMIDRASGILITSDNPQFAPDFISAEKIYEVWKACALVSKSFSRKPSDVISELNSLKNKFEELSITNKKKYLQD
jgi:phage repressor protein C with HTH and peptisase S24 domain